MGKKFLPNKDVTIINSLRIEYCVSTILIGIATLMFLALSIVENSVGFFVLSLFFAISAWWGVHRINQLDEVLYE